MSALVGLFSLVVSFLKSPTLLRDLLQIAKAISAIYQTEGKEAALRASKSAVEKMKRAKTDAEIFEALVITRNLSNGIVNSDDDGGL
jgi:hypothetical protein